MGLAEKEEAFSNELAYIKNPSIKEFAEKAVGLLPDYFYNIPASSTGKYHPAYSLENGGLYRHTKAAIRILVELYRMEKYSCFGSDGLDLCIASLLVHDGWKSGINQAQFSVAEHPMLAVQVLLENKEKFAGTVSDAQLEIILGNIASHMGQWNKDYKTKAEIMPKPSTPLQKLVHLADYLASRKCLVMDFDIPVTRE
jgi:hypothetical protein